MDFQDNVYDTLLRKTRSLSIALGYRDMMTRQHSERVQGLSEEIGMRYGLSEQELSALRMSAIFHDIGKIGTPDYVLLKPRQFNDDEWKLMRRHSEIGEKIVLSTELEGSEMAAQAIRHHHEYFDGRGYPDGLSGDEIPICSRIISIADSYDAMAVTRPYHAARSHSEIMKILEAEAGRKHDPQLMQIFVDFIDDSQFRTQ
jgi:HD-GYP domain-containing protein (c-di-GMP phosphodiesterase class II)